MLIGVGRSFLHISFVVVLLLLVVVLHVSEKFSIWFEASKQTGFHFQFNSIQMCAAAQTFSNMNKRNKIKFQENRVSCSFFCILFSYGVQCIVIFIAMPNGRWCASKFKTYIQKLNRELSTSIANFLFVSIFFSLLFKRSVTSQRLFYHHFYAINWRIELLASVLYRSLVACLQF